MATSWVCYRLFIQPANPDHIGAIDDYITLLQQVVHPLLSEHESVVGRSFFQQFIGPYRFHQEEGGVVTPIGAAPEDIVQFVRLSLEIDEDVSPAFFDRMIALCHASAVCSGPEVPLQPYDPKAELGGRFGVSRVDAVIETLSGASKLALMYATDGEPYDPTPNGQGGAAGLMHLMGSTLRYVVPGFLFENGMYHRMPLPCVVMDWQRELRFNSYPLP